MDLTLDHKTLEEAHETRRYFAKFEQIIGHLKQVADSTSVDWKVLAREVPILQDYLTALGNTFNALSYKYLMAGRVSTTLPKLLSIDRQESGFPIYQELLQMANDAVQADKHLRAMPSMKVLKQDMVRHIMNELSSPTALQFSASQRLYYDALTNENVFWAQNDPRAEWITTAPQSRRRYHLHWATYDSQQNIPIIYMMDLEDTGKKALLRDESRWPRVQSHLMAQSAASLKLLTIARGFDQDFDDLHPKKLRRFFIGPMYSHTFTQQSGPLRDVLADASGDAGLDWALAWTVETLESERVEEERVGFFGNVERQIFKLDPFAGETGSDDGVSAQTRSLVLPERPYQALKERNPAGFANVRKYVVSPSGRILSYR